MLEELRYYLEELKRETLRDRAEILEGFREAAFSFRELGERVKETELGKGGCPSTKSKESRELLQ